jgi:hypothetical protein
MLSNGFNFSKQRLRKKSALASGVCELIETGNSHQVSSLSFVKLMESIINLPQLTLLSKMEWQGGKIAQS